MNIPYSIGDNTSTGSDNSPSSASSSTSTTTTAAAAAPTEYHNLDCSWTIWVIDPTRKITQTTVNQTTSHDDYLSSLDNVGSFSTAGISPTWEDPINVNGGKWVLTFQNNPAKGIFFDIDLIWENLVLGIVGETIDTERDICGIVLIKRGNIERIAIWNRDASTPESIESLKINILNALPPNVASMRLNMKYQAHNLNNSNSSTSTIPNSSSNSNLSSYLNSSNSSINNNNNSNTSTTNQQQQENTYNINNNHHNNNNNINTNQS
ncbi:hypothetical protein DFA_06326 [Cavenderia fasciculata]|uniref:Eukaryotic translation initiation factor 4E n=1 Tax=Cavenderia fasciculata TaxID=261658 RepID=F4PKQ5_CACFS|nr:uncharacterized protein DFA_06326 [Cavenderia fasciculata]EGG24179.1 hypothetical protein DFA_06326 [Cavenderia fasciculata]|eukprot:XP_004362030.1 hypothetical protein DFA_06326 [Cavenderia fasciculata]